jgi:hypothetical protein
VAGAYVLNAQWTTLTTQTSPEIAYALAGLLFVTFWVLFLGAFSPPPHSPQPVTTTSSKSRVAFA